MTFPELGLIPSLTGALEKLGITEPMPVQIESFPALLEGKHVYIQSPTGSGKTLAFLLPIYQKLDLSRDVTQAIIVAPTHELALQTHRVSCDLAQHAGLAVRNVLLIGGTSMDRQIEKLKKKPQIVIGTPGRVQELADKGKLKVKDVRVIVIDESDRLLAGDSSATVKKIIQACQKERQMIYVSATERPESSQLVAELSPDLVTVRASEGGSNPRIEHRYLLVEERDKPDVLRKFIHASRAERAIVFTHRGETAEVVAAKLNHHKIPVADLQGAFHKEERKLAMQGFRSGAVRVLVTSDVAARGLDIPGITHVVNLDMPGQAKDYLHRVGRTARAGASGTAVSLVTEPELRLVKRFARELEIELLQIDMRNGEIIELKG